MLSLSYQAGTGSFQHIYLQVHLKKRQSLLVDVDRMSLSKFQFEQISQSGLARGGFVPAEIDTNSFRTGAATPTAQLGLPGDRIRETGR